MYKIEFSNKTIKQLKNHRDDLRFRNKINQILKTIQSNPFEHSQSFESLVNLHNTYSRRIDIENRFIYSIDKGKKLIRVRSVWDRI